VTVGAALAIAVFGGLGAVLRYLIGRAVPRPASGFPRATLLINVSGAFLLGLATGLAVAHLVPEEWKAIVCTGLLGGYTTFSSASTETVDLIHQKRWALALLYAGGMFVAALAAAGAGLWLASQI
jgi:CrcB protein